MKKFLKEILIAVLSLLLLSACAVRESQEPQAAESEKTQAAENQGSQETEREGPQTMEKLPSIEEALSLNGVVWRYTDDPVRLAEINNAAWTEARYDDSGWAKGIGSFGARRGRLDELNGGFMPDLCLRQYLPDGNVIPVYYFRLVFQVENIENIKPYDLMVTYDDAAIIYLNGEPVFQGNVPDGGYSAPNEYGCAQGLDSPESENFTLNAGLFQEGENVLAVEVHQAYADSSDIYFELQASDEMYLLNMRNESLSLGVGENESEMLVTWQGRGTDGYVEVVPVKGTDIDDNLFSDVAIYQAKTAYSNGWGTNTYRAVLTDLKPGQEYAYRVTDAQTSEIHTFTAPDGGETYSFIAHGDPQIREKDDLQAISVYEDIINLAMDGRKPDLILSLGDQSDDENDEKLFLRYLSAEPLKEVPLAVIVGNHENNGDIFSRLFYVPGVDEGTIYSSGDMSGDYWFYRNHTLFLCLNSNNKDYESHQRFIDEAKEKCRSHYGEPNWTIAAFHHSIFSVGYHAASESILKRREALAPMFKEAGIDVVFSGHDHTYTRSFPMDGTTPMDDGKDGIIYFSLGSPTGTKYYDISEDETDYAAVIDDNGLPSVTRIDVTKDAMTITTFIYQANGSLNVLDSYKITKNRET